jgi:wyosine [tRNA(Phe)-imidazoG37] synthetase (radical SAM superfamily)
MLVFGPVPSRRLGRSLGINNIPFKTCSYSCKYCQLGRTNKLSIRRKEFISPEEIFNEANTFVESLRKMCEPIDYVTIVPDGEPTLDCNLGETILRLRDLGIKIAVICNSSLIDDDQVKKDLEHADLVSFKVDTAEQDIWKNVNCPHGKLSLEGIKHGLVEFASTFKGTLVTETMLLQNCNDSFSSLVKTADFIRRLNSDKSYILIPTRPPAVDSVQVPSIEKLVAVYRFFRGEVGETELIINNEGKNFSFINKVEDELLGITSVHPMREDAVAEYLKKSNNSWQVINNLIKKNLLKEVEYQRNKYYVRNFSVMSSALSNH